MEAPKRVVCERCRRPLMVCYCAHVPNLPTRTRVMLLQHPRERHVAVGTARMAHLALPNSVLRLGIDFSADAVVSAVVAESPPPFVLFPGPTARDAAELPRDRAITLIVLDGTWSQARKLLTGNPALAALPRVMFTPRQPSAYRIRRQPAAFCVSTIEALAEVLALLEPEGEGAGMARLLDPFHAMVARQERFATEIASGRHRRPEARVPTGEPAPPRRGARELAATLDARWANLVCVYGEANAWPKRIRDRPAPEIVHWLAFRPATGETFEAVVAPRQPLAPAVPGRIGVSAEALRDGMSVDAWHRAWAAFCQPADALVTWGGFDIGLAAMNGLSLPDDIFNLRREAHLLPFSLAHLRTVEEAALALALGAAVAPPPPSRGPGPGAVFGGRGGVRLGALARVLDAFAPLPAASAA